MPSVLDPDPALADSPVELLQGLVHFDTTNPPGNEPAYVEWTHDRLAAAGSKTKLYTYDPGRSNLVARISGGDVAPLLLYGHADVALTEGQEWTYPPFVGVVEDSLVWESGSLDMKGGVAMLLAAAVQAAQVEVDLVRDVLMMASPTKRVAVRTRRRSWPTGTPRRSRS